MELDLKRLPSYVRDNPWIEVLIKRAKELGGAG